MIGKSILHYSILEKLGQGGMGIVYLARDNRLNRKVALKFLPPNIMHSESDRKRFMIEAQAAAALNHPNIASIYAIEETSDFIFIVMEYIEGKELKDIINTAGAKQSSSFLEDSLIPGVNASFKQIVIQIARGLQAAHNKGIIHRDIKSSNIMINESGDVKIMDFGLAKISGSPEFTRQGATIGTTGYMAPEQIKAEGADNRTDIWALGVIIYELLTGNLPFTGPYEQAVFYSILNEPFSPLSGTVADSIPPEIEKVVNKCLQKEPIQRYQSIEELLTDLTDENKSNVKKIPASKKTNGRYFSNQKIKYIFLITVPVLIMIFLFIYKPFESVFSTLAEPDIQHLAVLPFETIGKDSLAMAFCDGLIEIITSKITQLEKFHGDLWVVPSSEIRQNKVSSASEAHKLFGVNVVISGSLQIIGANVRVSLNLIDALKLRQLSSTVIDVKKNELIKLQDKSVTALLDLLDREINKSSQQMLNAGLTEVPEAYEFYLQGLGFMQRYNDITDVRMAISLFKKAIEKDPSYALAYAGLASANWYMYDNTKDKKWIDLSDKACKHALILDDDLPEVNVSAGLIFSGTGRYKEAITAFEKALSSDTKNVSAFSGLAKAYEALNGLDKAEQTYKKAINLKPDYWGGYNALGVFYFKHGRYNDAIEQFRQVIELTPDNSRGYSNLGGIYYMINRWPEAREMFEKALNIKKTYRVCSNLGTLYYIEKKYEDAARMYRMALELNQSDYRIWGNLASAYYRSEKFKSKADSVYKKAIALAEEIQTVNPSDATVISSLGDYYSMTGQTEKSLEYINRALEMDGSNATVLYNAGTAYEQLGKREQAINWIIKAIQNGYSENEIENQPELAGLISDDRYKSRVNLLKTNQH